MTRRTALTIAPAIAVMAAPPQSFRYAICSGSFAGQTLAEMCASAKRLGYSAIELEPGMISKDPAGLSKSDRASLRKAIRSSGVSLVGLHGFLRIPQGMHLTTSDHDLQMRSWNYFDRLIDLAADLGDRPLMVLGQGKQREAAGTVTPRDAAGRLTDGLGKLAPHAANRGVTILLEPLAPHLCNVINTLDEAVAVVRAVGHPSLQTMFDTHNTAGERDRPGALLRRHIEHIRHIHPR